MSACKISVWEIVTVKNKRLYVSYSNVMQPQVMTCMQACNAAIVIVYIADTPATL